MPSFAIFILVLERHASLVLGGVWNARYRSHGIGGDRAVADRRAHAHSSLGNERNNGRCMYGEVVA